MDNDVQALILEKRIEDQVPSRAGTLNKLLRKSSFQCV